MPWPFAGQPGRLPASPGRFALSPRGSPSAPPAFARVALIAPQPTYLPGPDGVSGPPSKRATCFDFAHSALPCFVNFPFQLTSLIHPFATCRFIPLLASSHGLRSFSLL